MLLSELQERGGSFRNDPHNKWEKSSALTPCEEGNGGHEDLHENPERSDVSDEVSDECIQIFLSTFSQCSLGANEQPCSFLFLKLTVVELRFQCLKLTADQLDMLILGRPGRWTYKKKELIRSHPAQTTFSEVIKFPGKHFCFFTAYRKKETFQPEMSLK